MNRSCCFGAYTSAMDSPQNALRLPSVNDAGLSGSWQLGSPLPRPMSRPGPSTPKVISFRAVGMTCPRASRSPRRRSKRLAAEILADVVTMQNHQRVAKCSVKPHDDALTRIRLRKLKDFPAPANTRPRITPAERLAPVHWQFGITLTRKFDGPNHAAGRSSASDYRQTSLAFFGRAAPFWRTSNPTKARPSRNPWRDRRRAPNGSASRSPPDAVLAETEPRASALATRKAKAFRRYSLWQQKNRNSRPSVTRPGRSSARGSS